MLEIGCFSYAHFPLLIVAFKKEILAEDYAAETFYISNFLKATMIMWSDYSNKFFI